MPTAKSGNGRVEVRKTYKLFINGEFVRSESGRAYRFDGNVNIPRGSRKDLRDAVRAARGAVPAWSARTAMNRGQILYRAAEMLDGRRAQFIELLGQGGAAGAGSAGPAASRGESPHKLTVRAAHKEVDDAVEALVWYAGWTDKLAQVIGATTPVSGPYFNFTIPEPTGVVGIVAPEEPALVGLVRRVAPALCGGNAVVVLAPEETPLPALTLAEVLATSDLPAGVVNVLSGFRKELLPCVAGCTPDEVTEIEKAAADNVKRVVKHAPEEMSPYLITAFMEMKTVWHPVGV